MRLQRLWVGNYKNLRDCEVIFDPASWLTAVIGGNGSGKSNLIEAILHILIGVYLRKAPPFDFRLQYEAQGRSILLTGEAGKLAVQVDGERVPVRRFANQLRNGPAQVFYPELTFVYYSGECRRIRHLVRRYQLHFQRATREPETDLHRPLFVESTNEQARNILLALFAHRDWHFLHYLGLTGVVDVRIAVQSPEGFDPGRDEPKLWNTVGAVRRVLAAIDDTATAQEKRHQESGYEMLSEEPSGRAVERTYRFSDDSSADTSISALGARLAKGGDNLYLALQRLEVRGILCSVDFRLKSSPEAESFGFGDLSEGEKQLIAVVGALRLTNQTDNLVLLDEPDTHVNPRWTWDYAAMLGEALEADQLERTSVLMATHDPLMISGLVREQVLLACSPDGGRLAFTRPRRDPRGQGVANILCSKEFFGLPSSLDRETQKTLDERLAISVKPRLTTLERARLKELNQRLQIIMPGISERDPKFVAYLRQQREREVE